MAKTTKTVRKGFSYLSCDDFAAYLNHMARLGWHFTGWRAGLVFEKGEPENAVYAVEVFNKQDESDTRPLPETREFAEYCEAAGWQFVDASRKFTVFKRIREDAVPILTDEERFEAISRASGQSVWRWLGISLAWSIMQLLEFRSGFKYSIFRNRELIVAGTWFLLFILAAARALQFLLWKRRCVRRMDQGLTLFFGRDASDKWDSWLYLSILGFQTVSLAYIGEGWISLIILGMAAALVLMGFLIARFRPDATVSAIIQTLGGFAIFIAALTAFTITGQSEKLQDLATVEPPVVYAEIWENPGEPEDVYSKRYESVFGSWNICSLDYGDAELYYEVFRSDYTWVLDEVWRGILKGRATREGTDCTELWDAEVAILSTANYYKVRCENTILDIHCDRHPLTEADIAAIIEAFGLR